MTFSWYGKMHAFFTIFFSKVFRKKSIVVSGGDEVERGIINNKPWGSCAHPIKRCFVYFIFKFVDLILAHSEYNLNSTVQNARANPEKVKLVYHGVDTEIFRPLPNSKKENIIVTVGNVNEENLYRKGLLLFVESANYLPDIPFILVGKFIEKTAVHKLKTLAPPNVQFTDGVYGVDLVEIFSRAKVYVQPSICESFACAMAEAMLCECVPVVSKLAALPEIVGNAGIYIETLDAQCVSQKIQEALQKSKLGPVARKRITTNYYLKKREQSLLAFVQQLWMKDQ